MKDDTENIVAFFAEVQRVIKRYGYDHVIKKLRELHEVEDEGVQKQVSDYILLKTCNHYSLNRDDVLFSNKRGVISEARRMCYALMKEHLGVSDEHIGFLFGGRSRQYVNKELNELPLNRDKYATKEEAKFVEDFLFLTRQILSYKNECQHIMRAQNKTNSQKNN